MKPLYCIMQFCLLPKIYMFKLIQPLKISCRGSQESNAQLRQTEAKRPLCIRRQRARRRRNHIRANIIIAIPLRRSQHRQRRRSTTAHALKRDVKAHLLGRVIHSRFYIVRASRVIFTSDPVGRAKIVAARRRKRRCEGTVAEELEDFVRGAAKGLALVCCEGDQVGGPLVGVEVLQQWCVGPAPDAVGVALHADGEDGFGNGANPVRMWASELDVSPRFKKGIWVDTRPDLL